MIFNYNEYFEEYMNIIFQALSENREKGKDIYYESHHIIPKKVEPLLEKDKLNLVLLTPEEHFKCHILLPFFTEGWRRDKMLYAWHLMSKFNTIDYSEYSFLKEDWSKLHSNNMKNQKKWHGENNYWYGKDRSGIRAPMYNKKHSENSKQKMSNAHKGKKLSKDHINKMLESRKKYYENGGVGPMAGKKHTEEARKKMSEKLSKNHPKGMLGKKHSKETRKRMSGKRGKSKPRFKLTCPWCFFTCDATNAKRYHFDKCKWNWVNSEEIDKKIYEEPIWM